MDLEEQGRADVVEKTVVDAAPLRDSAPPTPAPRPLPAAPSVRGAVIAPSVRDAVPAPSVRGALPPGRRDGRPALTMPVPAGGRSAAAVPTRPQIDDLDLPPPGTPAPAQRPAARDRAEGFSGEAFIDRMGASGPSTPAAPAFNWREYRELIVTGLIGVLLLGAAITWRVMNPPDQDGVAAPAPFEERPGVVNRERTAPGQEAPPAGGRSAGGGEGATPAPTEPSPPPETAIAEAEPQPIGEAVPSPPPSPVKAAVPMLSIITVPDGAELEIGGDVVGRSPLIVPAPSDVRELRVVATKDGYERAESSLIPNDGGHFSGTLILVPKQKR